MKPETVSADRLPAATRRAIAEGRPVAVESAGRTVAVIRPAIPTATRAELRRQCAIANRRDAEDGDFWERVADWP